MAYVWTPPPELVEQSNLTAFLRATGQADYDNLAAKAEADPAWLMEEVFKGSAIVCACVPMPAVAGAKGLADELSSALVLGMGASYRPEKVLLLDDLPRTRNMNIMRRVLRAIFENKDPGDLSALANPEAIDHSRQRLAAG